MMNGTLFLVERLGMSECSRLHLLVGGVAGLGLPVRKLHFFRIAVVGSDVEHVVVLLASFVNLSNGLVAGLNSNDGCVILPADESASHPPAESPFELTTPVWPTWNSVLIIK
jgi:hypothetical protein